MRAGPCRTPPTYHQHCLPVSQKTQHYQVFCSTHNTGTHSSSTPGTSPGTNSNRRALPSSLQIVQDFKPTEAAKSPQSETGNTRCILAHRTRWFCYCFESSRVLDVINQICLIQPQHLETHPCWSHKGQSGQKQTPVLAENEGNSSRQMKSDLFSQVFLTASLARGTCKDQGKDTLGYISPYAPDLRGTASVLWQALISRNVS